MLLLCVVGCVVMLWFVCDCWFLFAVRCVLLLFVAAAVVARCSLRVVCCLLFVVRWLLFVCCLCVACCSLFVVRGALVCCAFCVVG